MLQTLLIAVLTGVSAMAQAQWQWINLEGHKVFSDRAPPTNIPDKNILKRPSGRLAPSQDAESKGDASAVPPAVQGAEVKPVGVDKTLEAKKKQAEEAEAAKRKAEEQRISKAKIENCARAKQAKASFDSGVRISRTNAAGEREIMDDAARASELQRIQSVIASDCK